MLSAEGYVAPTAQYCDELRCTRGGVAFERTLSCSKCRLEWKEGEMLVAGGRAYGKPCGCAADLATGRGG